MPFVVLEPGDPRWGQVFAALPRDQQDVFYAPGFAALCQETLNMSQDVRCATFISESGGVLLYPFVERRVADMVRADIVRSVRSEGLIDAVSLYGRGGVVGSSGVDDLAIFHTQLGAYMRQAGVLCGFDRFHPVIANHVKAPPDVAIRNVGGFVVVDIQPPLAELEASFKASVRKDMRKAERNGVTCFSEANLARLEDFLDVYYNTMDRNAATDFYYFPEAFFRGLQNHMLGQFHFFYALHDDQIVSCELVLHHGDYCHSFLGGTLRNALPLAANSSLKWEIFKRMKGLGCKYFLLGGGHAPDDGIFNYKRAYAPEGVKPSLVGGMVWQPDLYAGLKHAMKESGVPTSDSRFQFYDI